MTWYGQKIPMTTDKLSDFSRVKVDIGQTSFFEGREFRSYKELNIAPSGVYVIKAVVPVDVILTSLNLAIDQGHVRMATLFGGTPGGSFSETLPIFNRNNMTVGPNRKVIITPQVQVTAGGTVTGGVEIDVLRLKTSGNANFAGTVGQAVSDERGIAQGTFYYVFTNLSAQDAVTGVYRASWEERVAVPASPY